MTMLASQITSLTVVYSIVYSGVNQRKHQSSASLAFVREIHRGPVNFPHKWPVTRKMFPFDDVIMYISIYIYTTYIYHLKYHPQRCRDVFCKISDRLDYSNIDVSFAKALDAVLCDTEMPKYLTYMRYRARARVTAIYGTRDHWTWWDKMSNNLDTVWDVHPCKTVGVSTHGTKLNSMTHHRVSVKQLG